MTCHVSPETFSEILSQAPIPVTGDESQKWLICGLHTCGDLASTMIRSFVHRLASSWLVFACLPQPNALLFFAQRC